MTPEQKELKVEAFRAFINDRNSPLEFAWSDHNSWGKITNPLKPNAWTDDDFLIRLAPTLPTLIPWHNPEGVTQEQLGEGWRFVVPEELGENHIGACVFYEGGTWSSPVAHISSNYTYRTREPLPAKFQHLVPESEEARARKIATEFALSRGFEITEWLGGYGERKCCLNGCENDFVMITSSGTPYFVDKVGWVMNCFYARARKLPTEQEKAEAALNAYKLEPGERLVHRGERWSSICRLCSFLMYNPNAQEKVSRRDNTEAIGGHAWYAEILTEPEMVPFTQETWPGDATYVKSGRSTNPTFYVVVAVEQNGIRIDFSGNLIRWSNLLNEDWYYRTPRTTWTRAGKGVVA